MTKKEKIVALASGGALFFLAALFAIGILLHVLDFGSGTPGRNGFLYGLGNVVATAYGTSCVLIPLFFLVAGALCLDSRWSAQRACCLLVSAVPFFTIVVTEHSVRSIAATDFTPVGTVKVLFLAVIAALLVTAEYLLAVMGAGLIKDGISIRAVRSGAAGLLKKGLALRPHFLRNAGAGNAPRAAARQDGIREAEPEVEADDETLDDSIFAEPTICDTFFEDGSGKKAGVLAAGADDAEDVPHGFRDRALLAVQSLVRKGRARIEGFIAFTEQAGADGETEAVNIDDFYAEEAVAVKVQAAEAPASEDSAQGGAAPDESELPPPVAGGHEPPAALEHGSALAADEEAGAASGRPRAISGGAPVPAAPAEDSAVKVYEPNARDLSFAEVELEEGFTHADEVAQDDDATLDGEDIIAQFEQGNLDADGGPEAFGQEDYALPKVTAEDVPVDDAPSMHTALESVFAKMDEDVRRQVAGSVSRAASAPSEVAAAAPAPMPAESVHQIDDSLVMEGPYSPQPDGEEDSSRDAFALDDGETDEEDFEPDEEDDELLDEDDSLSDYDVAEAESAVEEMARSFGKTAVITDAQGVTRPIPVEVKRARGPYVIPTDLLTCYDDNPYWVVDDETQLAASSLKATLAEFRIEAEITDIKKGPVVTMFELLPAPGVKLSKIVNLQDNIALRLAASSVRIVAPIPGKHAVGIEVPNKTRAIISIRECLEQDRPEWKKMGVPVVLGKDIQGETKIMDLVKTPHLLIAGATGAGKSVCVNSMIVSMLYKRSPNEVKLILIDPKIVELKLYNDIPHLLTPVITDPKKAMQALQYCLCEMQRRYALLDGMGVREITSYNKKIEERHIATEKLPYLIVIIDEFADLMATTSKQLEEVLARLAAMSRAVGIHLVLATQRPSADVITGLIKANIPSRIAFMVASKMDSRIILDQGGADKLLGKGDMLYVSATDPFPSRIQGTFVSDQEVENVVNAVKEWGEPEYIDDEIFIDDDDDGEGDDMALEAPEGDDPLFDRALEVVVQAGKASASYIQRRLKIGYNRAARLVEEMEERGIVGPANGSKPREIIHIP